MGRITKLIARSGLVVIFIIIQSGCWSSSDSSDSAHSATLTTWQGIKVGRDSTLLNGLYRGQFNQSGNTTLMVIDGNIIGYNNDYGYLGYLNFDSVNQQFAAQLWRFPVVTNLFQNQWLVAGGSHSSETWNGIRFIGQNNQSSLVGDFVTPETAGSLVLQQVSLIPTAIGLTTITDQWQSGEHDLFITNLGLSGRFQGFNSMVSGCSYQGLVDVTNSLINSYQINLVQQQGCADFNGGPATGIAVFDDTGAWQWFLQRGNELSFQTFNRTSASVDDSQSATSEPDNTATETDSAAKSFH